MNYHTYESPFSTRYASAEMQYIFSQQKKFSTFRRLWVALARAEHALGLPVTAEQVAQLAAHVDDIDFAAAEAKERELRHDVMAHIHTYGVAAPAAAGIIHLGATSCYVGDNTDIIIMRDGLNLILDKLRGVMANLAAFAREYKSLPCLAYTHLQPAQLTTTGKRATLWLYELLCDYHEVEYRISTLKLLGQKGTTGTQASFVELFRDAGVPENEIGARIRELENRIAVEMGFGDGGSDGSGNGGNGKRNSAVVPVSGQTYTRKVDYYVLSALSGIAQSASKFANDIRILANFKEIEEPFEKNQVGSSAMPYKRNPMRCERISSISRYVMTTALNPALTAGAQWFERTLDDSANKRIAVAEAFLGIDGVLNLMLNVTNGLVVYPKVIEARIMRELPFMATENIMMKAVGKGGDRQELHEALRKHSIAAAKAVKEEGAANDLIGRIAADTLFGLTLAEIEQTLTPEAFTGRCAEQVDDFLADEVLPVIGGSSGGGFELSV